MDAQQIQQTVELFRRMAEKARADPEVAAQVRNALLESGLLDVFGSREALDVADLLDLGGESILRLRLKQMSLAELKQVVSANEFDPEKESARWRSAAKFIDLIVARGQARLEEELARQEAPSGAAWML
ncbi:MAG: hypothetical protein ACRDHE_16240 [Ktedonobacterales bacterium]